MIIIQYIILYIRVYLLNAMEVDPVAIEECTLKLFSSIFMVVISVDVLKYLFFAQISWKKTNRNIINVVV